MNAGLILIGMFFLLLILHVPIAWSIGMAVVIYMVTSSSFSLTYLAQTMCTACDSFTLMAIPLFILAGALMEGGGLSQRLINFADSMVGHKRGGLAIVTVLACMFFGAISGSSAATVATIGVIMVPSMIKQGYSKGFSYALIAAAGVLGVLIPPSIPFVTYGVATNASIATMFLGGFGPGILCGVLLIAFSQVICRKNGWEGNGRKFTWKRVGTTFFEAIGALLVPVIILGGIYGGFFTPTEAAAIAVVYACIAALCLRDITFRDLPKIFMGSCKTAAQIMILISASAAFAQAATIAQIPAAVAELLSSLNRFEFLLILNLILLVVGCFFEPGAAVLILSPILFPTASALGIDPIHLGIVFTVNLAIGMFTPPFGLNLFVVQGVLKKQMGEVSRAVIPYIILYFGATLIITYVDKICLILPNLLM